MRKYTRPYCFILILFLYHLSYGQQHVFQNKVNLNFDKITLEEALILLSDSFQLKFSYNPDKLPLNKEISLKAKDITIEQALRDLCEQAGLSYSHVEEQIILKEAAEKEGQTGKIRSESRESTLSGYIKDEETGEILIGASLYFPEQKTGTISNSYGFFSITFPDDRYTMICSYIGYQSSESIIDLTSDQSLDITLKPSSRTLEEILVTDLNSYSVIGVSQMSSMEIEPDDIMKMPSFMGEGDVIKSLQSVPGIKLHGDGSTWFYVRGGERDQNLILLDEAPIYNPSHLLGLFSTFVPDAVKDITIYKGDIPASYGGRLSSLVDVKTIDGNMKKFKLDGSLGLLSTKLSFETPVVKEKGSVFLSSRFSRLEWIFRALETNVKDFNFYDLNFKINWRFSEKDRVFLNFYSGEDLYSQQVNPGNTSGLNWSNNAFTLRWNHVFTDKLFSNSTLYASSYDYSLFTSIEDNNHWNSAIANLTIKTDFSWYDHVNSTWYAGLSFSGHNINPGNLLVNGRQSPLFPSVSRKHNREWAFYGENDLKINERLNLRYGLRLSVWDNTGESFEISYNENYDPVDTVFYDAGEPYGAYGNLEPRISLNYRIGPAMSLKFSYNKTSQYLHLINNSISPFTTLDVWLPSGPNIPDQKAHQVAAGLMYNRIPPGLNFKAEVYYKDMSNQIGYTNHADMILNPLVESELRFGDGWSYGLELSAEKKMGKLRGWTGYTFSRTWKKISGINNGNKFPAFYDRPHEYSLFITYDWSDRFNTSLNWYYSTGAAFTSPVSFYTYNGHTVPVYNEINNDRFPNYHRLDLSLLYRLNKRPHRYQHQLGLTLYNLYGRKNPFFIHYNKIQTGENTFRIPGDLGTMPDLVASQRYVHGLIPSITYHFTWQ